MRLFVIALALVLAACSSVPDAPQIPDKTGYLTQRTTRQLVEYWAGNGYPDTVAGRPIRLVDEHPHVENITGLTPAEKFSKDDKNPGHLGTVAMMHTREDLKLKQITSQAWQFTSQPATIVARSERDGSLKLTALDFRENNQLGGLPLASNFRLPFDFAEEQEPSSIVHLLTLLDPAGWSDRRGFYLATEYDPEKIPLIFIHGLLSTPVDFEFLASTIASKPDLWDRYQFWFYFYPTGDPWVLTAANFREDFRVLVRTLDPDKNDRPLRKETTIVAHSMGGLITRLSLSEEPEKLYQKYFNRPVDDIRLLPYQRKRIREQLLFEPLEEPSKVIFLATPHKGAGLAGGPLLWLAQKLVKAPARILGTTLSTAQNIAFAEPGILTQQGASLLSGNEVSVSELNPESAALQALNEMPIRSGVELHNIVATITGSERGLGDWVVPYTSAKLEQADSQTIVRSGHWLIKDKETAEEVIKLLRR
ncbi:alpha/beta hydrolase [Roseibacillus persicicus]|uniref:esterase/lipase family protein n=1 Tax=Roseibacillus persicicus TaxID=454148 RepID=UPI00398B0A1F